MLLPATEPSARRRRAAFVLALIVCVLVGLISVAGCGSSSQEFVATVGADRISKATLDRWTRIEAIVAHETVPAKPPASGVVPDPPEYVKCVAYLRRGLASSASETSSAQLKSQCARSQQTLRDTALQILITYHCLESEARERGVTVPRAEVVQFIRRQLPTHVALTRFLRFTGERVSDAELLARRALLSIKVEAQAGTGLSGQRKLDAEAKFAIGFAAKWSARTSCRPGYVIEQCREFKAARS
jgi:hypothetical protein